MSFVVEHLNDLELAELQGMVEAEVKARSVQAGVDKRNHLRESFGCLCIVGRADVHYTRWYVSVEKWEKYREENTTGLSIERAETLMNAEVSGERER